MKFSFPQRPFSVVREQLLERSRQIARQVKGGSIPVPEARSLLQQTADTLDEGNLQEAEWPTASPPAILQPRRCPHGGGGGFCLQCGKTLCESCQTDGRCAVCSGPLRGRE